MNKEYALVYMDRILSLGKDIKGQPILVYTAVMHGLSGAPVIDIIGNPGGDHLCDLSDLKSFGVSAIGYGDGYGYGCGDGFTTEDGYANGYGKGLGYGSGPLYPNFKQSNVLFNAGCFGRRCPGNGKAICGGNGDGGGIFEDSGGDGYDLSYFMETIDTGTYKRLREFGIG